MPLAVLALVATGFDPFAPAARSFFGAVGVHARYLVSLPLLVVADALCVPRLWRIVGNFAKGDIVVQRERYDAALASAQRAFVSRGALVVIVALAYVGGAAIALTFPMEKLPEWHRVPGATTRFPFSPAGWWHVAVSIPILLTLLNGWIWRICVWALLLVRIARCDLRLMASHPDGVAGIGFMGGSLRAFASLGFAFATMVASRSLQLVVDGGKLPTPYLYTNGAILGAFLLLCGAPLFAFSPTLMLFSRRASPAYARVALRMGRRFERQWLERDLEAIPDDADDDPLHVQDFSATTDLYSVVANARGIRFVPFGKRDVFMLAASLLAPFIPVVLLTVPLTVVLKELRSLIL